MGEDVLSQSEIDKLLSALSTGAVSAEEVKADGAAGQREAVALGAEAFLGVGEYGQADDGLFIAVADAVVVGEHAFGKVGFWFALHFDMDQEPVFLAIQPDHPDQFVGITPMAFCV